MANEPMRSLTELRTSGLLWLFNTSVMHPRGFAIALVLDHAGEAIGWQLLGDGSEPWTFLDGECNDAFAAVRATLNDAECVETLSGISGLVGQHDGCPCRKTGLHRVHRCEHGTEWWQPAPIVAPEPRRKPA